MSKEVDQNKLEEGRGGAWGGLVGRKEAGDRWMSGIILSITCVPQLSAVLGRRAHVERSVRGGLRYQCALALSGGRVGCLVPQQPPTPSAEVDGVLLWKHEYTRALLPQSTYLHSAWKQMK